MIVHNNNGQEFLLVEVPEWYNDPIIAQNGQNQAISNCGEQDAIFPLPLGEWEIVGKGDELTEEQAKQLVDNYFNAGPINGGDDYVEEISFRSYISSRFEYSTAKTSVESLFISHSLTPANTLVLKRKSDG